MATSSILKDFYVYDEEAFERLKKELDEPSPPPDPEEEARDRAILERSEEKLAKFVFRSKN